jgi:hypothetical protein
MGSEEFVKLLFHTNGRRKLTWDRVEVRNSLIAFGFQRTQEPRNHARVKISA